MEPAVEREGAAARPRGARNWRWWVALSGPRGREVMIITLSALFTVAGAAVLLFAGRIPVGLMELGVGLLGTAALGWRRRYPLLVTAFGIPVFVLTGNVIPIGFGLMRIAITRRDRVLVVAAAAVAITFAVPVFGTGDSFTPQTLLAGALGALFFAMWGAYVGARRDLISSLEGRAERAEQERELKAEQARLSERSRIAGEMHDVLAHKVSLIALQAGGLEVNPDSGPEVVERTAALIRTTARQALEDLRGVLGVLRADQGPQGSELVPQPGMSDLERLIESSRAAGVQVSLAVAIDADLPEQLGRTIYRIVQESLTNVHKHARGAATAVEVRQQAGRLAVSVTNRRPVGVESLLPGSGSGLIGLRERVGVLGGSVRSGPTPEGGWSVTADLPIDARAGGSDVDTIRRRAGTPLLTGVDNQ